MVYVDDAAATAMAFLFSHNTKKTIYTIENEKKWVYRKRRNEMKEWARETCKKWSNDVIRGVLGHF